MASFELPKWTTLKIEHVNLRKEKHGKDASERAIDIKVSMTGSNQLLELFHSKLRQKLVYNRARENGENAIQHDPEVLPNVLFPQLKQPHKWDVKVSNCVVVFDYGTGGASNIDLAGCKVGPFEFTVLEGGSCRITWPIQVTDFADGVLDKLSYQMGNELPALILPPGAVAQVEGGWRNEASDEEERGPGGDANQGGLFGDDTQEGGGEDDSTETFTVPEDDPVDAAAGQEVVAETAEFQLPPDQASDDPPEFREISVPVPAPAAEEPQQQPAPQARRSNFSGSLD